MDQETKAEIAATGNAITVILLTLITVLDRRGVATKEEIGSYLSRALNHLADNEDRPVNTNLIEEIAAGLRGERDQAWVPEIILGGKSDDGSDAT